MPKKIKRHFIQTRYQKMNQETVDKFVQLFDNYLDGQLNSIDESALQTALTENPQLQSALKEHIESRANIRLVGEDKLKNLFLQEFDANQSINETNQTEPTAKQSDVVKNKPNHALKYVLLGLLLGAMIMAAYFLTSKTESKNKKEPLLIAMVEDPSYEQLRGETDSLSVNNWRQAVQSFIKQDYQNSLSLLETINGESEFMIKHGGKYELMNGVANLKLEQFDSAETALLKITKENPYYDQAEWYLALVSFFNKNDQRAKERLTKIVQNENHYKVKAATQLLSQLE